MGAMGGLVEHLPDRVFRLAFASLIALATTTPIVCGSRLLSTGRTTPSAMIGQVRSLDLRDTLAIQDDLRRLRVPSRVVWGTADQFQKVRYGERLASDLGTDLRRIDGGKHWTPEDHASEVAAAINELALETSQS